MLQLLKTLIITSPNYLNPKIIQYGAKGKKVYFGTGLASAKEESRGFGFEFLNPALTSLVIMKELGADGVFHEIGTVGYHISEDRRNQLFQDQLSLIKNMICNLGLENVYSVTPSHSYQGSDYFKCILQEVRGKMRLFRDLPNFKKYGGYTLLQIAQMKYLYDLENAVIKVGWVFGNNAVFDEVDTDQVVTLINKGHLSEYYFDSIYRYVFPDDEFSFVYTTAGMDIINGKKYAPYTVTKSQARPLLTQPIKEYLEAIPNSYHKRRAMRNYGKTIVGSWEYLFGEIESFGCVCAEEQLIEKLRYIQNRVLGAH